MVPAAPSTRARKLLIRESRSGKRSYILRPALPLREGRICRAQRQQIRGGVTTLGSSPGKVVTPPRKSLPLRVSDLSALPQGEGWAPSLPSTHQPPTGWG